MTYGAGSLILCIFGRPSQMPLQTAFRIDGSRRVCIVQMYPPYSGSVIRWTKLLAEGVQQPVVLSCQTICKYLAREPLAAVVNGSLQSRRNTAVQRNIEQIERFFDHGPEKTFTDSFSPEGNCLIRWYLNEIYPRSIVTVFSKSRDKGSFLNAANVVFLQ